MSVPNLNHSRCCPIFLSPRLGRSIYSKFMFAHDLQSWRESASVTIDRWGNSLLLMMLACSQVAAAPPPKPDQGSITPGGKFIPASAGAPDTRAAPVSRNDGESALRKDLRIERISPGKLKIGMVILEETTRSVHIPATVNMVDGPVEYALVTATGKIHESVFVTSSSVRDIHIAMLLLGIKPPDTTKSDGKTLQIPKDAAIRVRVEWETNGPRASHPLTSMISIADTSPDRPNRKTLVDRTWLYKGSSFDSRGFCALREGSIIALITDDLALACSPELNGQNRIISPDRSLVPRVGTPVSVVISRDIRNPGSPTDPTPR